MRLLRLSLRRRPALPRGGARFRPALRRPGAPLDGYLAPRPPGPLRAPLGRAAERGLFYRAAAHHRPGVALRAGPSAGGPNKNKGAAPRRLHFDAGPRRRRRAAAGDGAAASGIALTRGRRRGRGRPCPHAGPAPEPSRVSAVTAAGRASAEPSGEGRGAGPVPPRHRPG